ncbi:MULTISPECIES: RNA polymerase sigma factor [unclassified Leucobacter]|uniref:RNA polymerase sigma factor n=1 Tax=unclassified Leucobacter TaxID=2621730 RepID=UPI0030182D3F
MHSSDEELARLVRTSGDADAFSELYRRHVDAARAASYRIAPRLDKEDLAAEAFARILKALRQGHGPRGVFRPYLYQVIRRVSAEWTAESAHLSGVSIEDLDPAETASFGDLSDAVADRERVLDAFARLPERYQTVLWYLEVEGYSAREVAVMLAISANNVAQIRSRARKRLRTLDPAFGGSRGGRRSARLGRKLLVAAIGLPAALLLAPEFQRTPATAAGGTVPVLKLLIVAVTMIAVAGMTGAWLVLFVPTGSPAVPTEQVAPSSPTQGPQPESTRSPNPSPGPSTSAQGDRSASARGAGQGERTASPIDPGPWERIPQKPPVVRGPSE